MAYNTICLLITEVCATIVETSHEEVILTTTTPEDWMVIANNNYKNFHSIVLMALVDGDYKFTWVAVGANGPSSDAQIFEDCGLKQAI